MQKTMLAVVKPEAAPGAEIREVKVPAFGRNDVLVKVKVASICGTDLHIYEWDRWAQNRIHPPLIPGHEFCGEVAAFGDEVTSVKEGDFVSAEMHVACGKCLLVPHRRSPHLPEREDHRRGCRRRVRRVRGDSGIEYLEARSRDSAGIRVDSRSPGQRGPQRAGGRDCRQDGRDHRLWADRTVLDRGGPRGRSDHDFCHRGERASPEAGPGHEGGLRSRSLEGRRARHRDGANRRTGRGCRARDGGPSQRHTNRL